MWFPGIERRILEPTKISVEGSGVWSQIACTHKNFPLYGSGVGRGGLAGLEPPPFVLCQSILHSTACI